MKVSELPYRRVTLEEVQAVMDDVLPRIRNAKSVQEILAAREDYLKMLLEYQSNAALAYMRYSINTADEFYVAENSHYDEIGPAVQNASVEYACWILLSARNWKKCFPRSCSAPWKFPAKPCLPISLRTWWKRTNS